MCSYVNQEVYTAYYFNSQNDKLHKVKNPQSYEMSYFM